MDHLTPLIECEQIHPTLSVSDVGCTVDFYTQKLGFVLAFAEGKPATFVGLNLGQVQIFMTKGTPSPFGCCIYFVVGNADELCVHHRANGVEILEGPQDRDDGLRDYTVRDQDGYALSFGHHLRTSRDCD